MSDCLVAFEEHNVSLSTYSRSNIRISNVSNTSFDQHTSEYVHGKITFQTFYSYLSCRTETNRLAEVKSTNLCPRNSSTPGGG
ncbi:hypothetical protein Y032_0165g25 [Ancylostoma ceylanicum]|uniref:Uncharacterized protein n=1 Tax=Ancylostoma ceylanicum TaxID=53326 RepID=A0A016SX39_9BILA|nr:hypothetical protein Y032_0165g25 [Ancylostoma ceylanicum]